MLIATSENLAYLMGHKGFSYAAGHPAPHYASSDKALAAAASCLQQNQLVAVPTETVYGLAANAFEVDAVAKIFAMKQRPAFDPLIVHVARRDSSLAALQQMELLKLQALLMHNLKPSQNCRKLFGLVRSACYYPKAGIFLILLLVDYHMLRYASRRTHP